MLVPKLSLCCLLLLSFAVYAQNPSDLSEKLLAASRKGDMAAIKELLDKGADVNAKTDYGVTPLSYACDRGHLEVVRILIERGADINAKDTFYEATPLEWAISKNHVAVVKLLLEKGAQSKEKAMAGAVQEGKLEIAKAILDLGRLKQEVLNNCLVVATYKKHTEIAELLKKAGANPTPSEEYKIELEMLNGYVGLYKSDRFHRGSQLEHSLLVKDGKLILEWRKRRELNLKPTGRHAFGINDDYYLGWSVIFDADGSKITALRIRELDGTETVYKRVEARQ